MDEAVREIVEALMRIPLPSRDDVARVKIRVAAKYGLGRIPSNAEIIAVLKAEEKAKLLPVLRRKATRAISGVTVVAVMTRPYPCPQQEPCAYCPGGPPFGVPQSYTGFEPAAMRGLQHAFDPYGQVRSRIEQLRAIGHKVDKVELIVMGGTFPATPYAYQTWFVQRCLDAIAGVDSAGIEEAKRLAETSCIRNVGITVETRPDWAKTEHVDRMLEMGVTRVELGVQNPDDGVYRLVGRKHTVADVVEATRILKDAGLKVVYHMMPGLPGSSIEKDLEAFKRIFADSAFKPDMIKIYPCLVLKDTKAYDWFLRGEYKPYTTEDAARLIVEVKRMIPSWVRIMRVQRDIPAPLIVAGVKMSNLRQLVQQKLKEQGLQCRCIRCREVGHRLLADGVKPDPEKVRILTTRYEASEGEEIFISAEDIENDVLIGYLRLRIPSEKAHRPEIRAEPCSIIRELHVYGPVVPVGKHLPKAWQHKGYGSVLLAEAERITRQEYGFRKILVISALGTKQYYKRFGYKHEGPYMTKTLENKVPVTRDKF
ncbi:MAG: tRNA uridine(34) 5-carboxymethylaminomethyl modification radical SAM/GNAT enzyme Elp3 [Candidatus Bathyarchaeota archaeon]|nr:tRNA uridine(34) 5-carboxymethylaminomethyl modification radical SAM/GNAT enzyme Elp3 [Candidatus Bathyarchaeota archaeon A05DMB-3]MDH7607413.1 tRNA uridine(34) 5-carboxymethylaminomethyl modification radical SAM/GNAT enzyme Elp3 [Candidatus Bathyarchaeota archaeon]